MKSVMEKEPEAASDFDKVMEKWGEWLPEFIKGNHAPFKALFSRKDDATLANPFGSVARGWQEINKTIDHSIKQYRDGEMIGTEIMSKYVTPELAFLVEIARFNARIGTRNDMTPVALRITSIIRPEDGTWKIMHLQADPRVARQPAESIIQQ
jgi:hypothetical protein